MTGLLDLRHPPPPGSGPLARDFPACGAGRSRVSRLPVTPAVIDEAVAGFIVIVGDEAEQVYVDRARRGTGLAAVLLAEAERQIAAAGHPLAWLAVAAGNERARRFYERSGWADAGAFDYHAEGPDGPLAVPCHRYERSFD